MPATTDAIVAAAMVHQNALGTVCIAMPFSKAIEMHNGFEIVAMPDQVTHSELVAAHCATVRLYLSAFPSAYLRAVKSDQLRHADRDRDRAPSSLTHR